MKNRWFLLLLIVFAGLSHFSDGEVLSRKLIDYDDTSLIKPMVKLSLAEYFTEWLPIKSNHAHPIRDMTYFLDHQIGSLVGGSTYWLTNLLLFGLYLYFILKIVELFISNQLVSRSIIAITTLHPINLEILQWITSRKHLMVGLFLAPATYIVLQRFKNNKQLSIKDILLCFALYICGLLCYPTGIIWPFFLGLVLVLSKQRSYLTLLSCLLLPLAAYNFLTTGQTDFARTVLGYEWHHLKSLFWGIGRGAYTTVIPWPLSIYYNDTSILNIVGLIGLILGSVAFIVFAYRKSFFKSSIVPILTLLLFLIASLFIPQTKVLIIYPDFVWADRYIFIILPYLLLIPALMLQESKLLNPKIMGLCAAFTCICYTFINVHRTPLWRDTRFLLEDCLKYENTPRCSLRLVNYHFVRSQCNSAKPFFEEYENLSQKHTVELNYEYFADMPFYESSCIALHATMHPLQKTAAIEPLFHKYPGSGEPLFGLTLSLLEAGRLDDAIREARSYYLSPSIEANLGASNNVKQYYFGHIKALCEIAGTLECHEGAANYYKKYHHMLVDKPRRERAYKMTMFLWNRRHLF